MHKHNKLFPFSHSCSLILKTEYCSDGLWDVVSPKKAVQLALQVKSISNR